MTLKIYNLNYFINNYIEFIRVWNTYTTKIKYELIMSYTINKLRQLSAHIVCI